MGSGLEDIRIPEDGDRANKRALVIAAHPDDSEFGAAGTIALWARDGWEVYYLICTDGSKGTEDDAMTPDKLVPLRREEQRAAAQVLGVKEVFFLDYIDGELAYTPEFSRDVVRAIRIIRPHTVFSHDPNQIVRNTFINHPDHRCAGTVALDAVYPLARNRPTFPELLNEGLEPYSAKKILLWSTSDINHSVDITDVIDLKLEALSKHVSQLAEMMETRLEQVRSFWKSEDGRYMENFRHIPIPF
jgi:LmbE family N-acetylglucosaminyl deacetylase